MATITLEYDDRNAGLRKLVEAFVALGGKVKESNELKEPETHYDPEFIEKIHRSEKSKGVKIKTEDLWK